MDVGCWLEPSPRGYPCVDMSLDVPLALIKDPELWTEEDVGVWLQWLGLPRYVGWGRVGG